MNRSAKEIYLMLNGSNDTDTVIQNLDELYPDAGLNQIRQDSLTFMDRKNGFNKPNAYLN